MTATLRYVVETHCEGLVVRVALNHVDVFSEWSGGARKDTAGVNPFVVEGTNTLEVFLAPMTDDAGAVMELPRRFRVSLHRAERDQSADESNRLAHFEWSERAAPLSPGGFAGVWARQLTVRPEHAFGRWCWQEVTSLPPGGDDAKELVALAEIVHAALARRDVDAVLSLTELRNRELARAAGVSEAHFVAGQAALLRRWFASKDWALDAFDAASLAATRQARGRLVRITDPWGDAPIKGTDGARRFTFAFMAARIDGAWTIAR